MIVNDRDVRKGEKELSVKETNLAHWKLHSSDKNVLVESRDLEYHCPPRWSFDDPITRRFRHAFCSVLIYAVYQATAPCDERDQPVGVGCLYNETTFPSGTGSNERPAGVPGVVFAAPNVGVPADEEGGSVATPFRSRGIDPGTLVRAANVLLRT